MPETTGDVRNQRPRAASVSIGIGTLGWLSPVIAVIGGLLIDSGGSRFAGDGGPNLIWILYLIFGAITAGVLGIVGSLICLVGCGASPYPEKRRPWLLPKIINFPLGLFGLVGALYRIIH
jgi:hypothetical protein